jgi:hypothetical protein
MAERQVLTGGVGADFKPITLTCCDCADSFQFSIGEQAWYSSQGYTPPKRCKKCREERRRQRDKGN